MTRYAIFGDSYVSRQQRFGGTFPFPGEVRFFGRGGMRAQSIPEAMWEELLDFAPDVCVLHFGGNDINRQASVRDIAESILHRVGELEDLGVSVIVAEILPRKRVRGNIDQPTFDRMRKAINVKLRRKLRSRFAFLRVHVDTHYLTDGVHLSLTGQYQYHWALLRVFSRWL